jgi:hypothetical protein
MQGRASIGIPRIGQRTPLKQQLDNLRGVRRSTILASHFVGAWALADRPMQRRPSEFIGRVGISPGIEQGRHGIPAVGRNAVKEGCVAQAAAPFFLSARGQQSPDDRAVAFECCCMEWSVARL